MKHRVLIAVLAAAALALFVGGIAAQHQHPPSTTSKPETKADMSKDMMAHHQEMQKLVDQLQQSFDAIEVEKDASALKEMMAEHRALIQQLQGRMKQCSEMSAKMSEHMRMCPMMKSEHKRE